MPNWCNNIVLVSGPRADLNEFVNRIESRGNKSLFGRFSPCPPDDVLAKNGTDAYNWHIANWGTKWDVPQDEVSVSPINDKSVSMNFSTAWSPPLAAIEAMSKQHPALTFEALFEEPGMCFEGKFVFRDGCEVCSIEQDITSHSFIEDESGEWVENPDFIPLEDRFED